MTHAPHPDTAAKNPQGSHLRKLMIGAIGVVYGDIGTSPLYTIREAFMPEHGIAVNESNILGMLSIILWSLIIVISVKYIMVIMRADNRGEGGILALMTLAHRALKSKPLLVTCLGIIGASLLYSDGMITPAISVLSAVEGLRVATPLFDPYIVPMAIVIIVILFASQHNGTDIIGRLFGPVTLVWFFVIGSLGLYQIMQNQVILLAFSPLYAVQFMIDNAFMGFLVLGTVVLCITGGEALYLDMGHFGAKPIRMAWLCVVMPCLMLNYLGQGALILKTPEAIDNPFYKMVPEIALYPMIALATMATVIASQAMISGAFSITQQAIHLDFLPRLKLKHTSSSHIGQIYLPTLNLLLFIGVILLVLWFHSSSALAAAYGIAVTGTMLITSILVFIVAWKSWNWPLWKVLLIVTPLGLIDLTFFTATLSKLQHGYGGWVPLIVGSTIFTIILTWYQGKEIKNRRMAIGRERLDSFIQRLSEEEVIRVQGTAVYMTRDTEQVPPAMAINVKHYKALHERVLLVNIQSLDVPHAPDSERFHVKNLGSGFIGIDISFGFMQHPNIPRALHHLSLNGVELDIHDLSYFMNRVRVIPTPGDGMWLWREKLYALMYRNAAEASDYFNLPNDRVIETGSPITI